MNKPSLLNFLRKTPTPPSSIPNGLPNAASAQGAMLGALMGQMPQANLTNPTTREMVTVLQETARQFSDDPLGMQLAGMVFGFWASDLAAKSAPEAKTLFDSLQAALDQLREIHSAGIRDTANGEGSHNGAHGVREDDAGLQLARSAS